MKIPQEYLDMTNDFGFTAVDDDEVAEPIVESYKSASDKSISELSKSAQGKLLDVERLIMPLFCLLYTSPSPRDRQKSRMPSSA